MVVSALIWSSSWFRQVILLLVLIEVHNLKEKVKTTTKKVKDLEESVDFNDEIANLKRDLKASQKLIDELSKHLLYQGITVEGKT